MHIPVLLQEVLEVLEPKPGEIFADGTLGGGGHAREILVRITPAAAGKPGGTLLAVDRDRRAIEQAAKTLQPQTTVRLLIEPANYVQLPELMKRFGINKLDGLLIDLGFSSEQITGGTLSGRGFSFMTDEPLLMTYDDNTRPLAELLAELSEKDLAAIIREYGEERYSGQIANCIASAARHEGIATTGQLVAAIKKAVPANYENGRINPATRTFQALRIYTNGELRQLEELLGRLPEMMAKGGRVAVISFHSLEDRIVKHHFQQLVRNNDGRSVRGDRNSGLAHSGETPNSVVASGLAAQLITKKPITASEQELAANPRSRSAKLRAIRFL